MIEVTQAIPEANAIAQTATVVVIALVGAIFGIQKILKGWKETSTESNLISLMHSELTRLSTHNAVLAEELAKFQLEVVSLNKQINNLTVENSRLYAEIAALTNEVNRLQEMIEGAQKQVKENHVVNIDSRS